MVRAAAAFVGLLLACDYNAEVRDCRAACNAASGCPTGLSCSESEGRCRTGETSTPCAMLDDPGTPPRFAGNVDFPTGTSPSGVAIGDLNDDGKPDLAVVTQGGGTSVLFNTTASGATTPSFAAKVDFPAGLGLGIAIGDLNGDYKPDIAVTSRNSGAASVLLNTTASGATTPSFATKVDFTTASNPRSIGIGDFNGDGKPDLAVVNTDSSNLSALLNTTATGAASPSFASAVNFTTGSIPFVVAIGDLNGDGRPDLAVSNNQSNSVSILLNTTTTGATTPSFATRVDFTLGTRPGGIVIADLNRDGKLDLAVTNSGADSVSVFLNTTTAGATTPSLMASVDFPANDGPSGIAIGDFNSDSNPDLAIANFSSNTDPDSVSVLANATATGATTPSFATRVDFPTGDSSLSVAVGDFNQDGKPDLAVANAGSSTVSVLLAE